MRVLLKLEIDCDVDAAWRALHSPRAVAELYGPLVDLDPLDPGGLPTSWPPAAGTTSTTGAAAVGVQLRLGGILPLGRQLIHAGDLTLTDPRDGAAVRTFRDSGIPISGPLAALDVWDHQIAVSPAPGNPTKTLWRDRLVIGGTAAPLLWPVLWSIWQWRAARVRALAPGWAHDPEPQAHDPEPQAHDPDPQAHDPEPDAPDARD